MLGANAKMGHSFVNMTMTREGIMSKTETCPKDPAIQQWSRHLKGSLKLRPMTGLFAVR